MSRNETLQMTREQLTEYISGNSEEFSICIIIGDNSQSDTGNNAQTAGAANLLDNCSVDSPAPVMSFVYGKEQSYE